MKLARVLVLLLLPTAALAAESSPEDPVTYLGEHVLSKTDVVLFGEAAQPVLLPTGARIVRVTVTEVLEGTELAKTVLIVSGSPDLIPPVGAPGVLFLKRLGRGRYEPVGLVDALGKDGKLRVATLRRYLEIERMADAKKKRVALRDYLLVNLESNRKFLRWSAAREFAHYTRRNGSYLSPTHLDRMRKARDERREPVFIELMETALRQVDSGATEGPDTSARLKGPDGPEYRELRKLLREWQKGIKKPEDRLAHLKRITSRWLKHSAPLLMSALGDEAPSVRRFAALQLGEGEFAAAAPHLRKKLPNERDREVLGALIHSLGILGSKDALPVILTLGKADDLRRTAAFAAARIGGPLAKDWFDALLATHNRETEKDREIRRLVTFLKSDAFKKQEKALSEIRKKRLR